MVVVLGKRTFTLEDSDLMIRKRIRGLYEYSEEMETYQDGGLVVGSRAEDLRLLGGDGDVPADELGEDATYERTSK